MMCSAKSLFDRMAIGAVFCLLIVAVPAAAQQEQISPTSDYQYRKDYAEVETILKETDPDKRAEMLLAFVKARPLSRMNPHIPSYYLQIVAPHQQAGNWDKVITMTEALVAALPDDKTALPTLMAAYYQKKNLPKAAEIGEKIYAANPDKVLASELAGIFLQIQNTDKYLEYAEKVLAEFPMEQAYGTALQVAQVYLQKQDVPKATELLAKVMEVYGDKVPQGMQEPAWNQSRAFAFGLMGASAYARKDYARAIELYGKVARFAPKTDDAYYYIGMSKWNTQDPEGAIESFAKVTVLGKTNAKKAQEYLEQLYKARNNDSLEGLDKVLEKAKAELGIS